MNYAKHTLTGGFMTKTRTNVNKSGIVVAHQKVLQHNKNVKNVNANDVGPKRK
jgi:hypothetical protein